MLTLQPIVDHLKTAGGYESCEGVMEFIGLKDLPRLPRALFVIPQAERAAPNKNATGVTDQRVSHGITIALVLRAPERRPGAVSDELAEEARKICKLMLGWKHPSASRRWEYDGGNLGAVDGPVVTWFLGFSAPYHLRG